MLRERKRKRRYACASAVRGKLISPDRAALRALHHVAIARDQNRPKGGSCTAHGTRIYAHNVRASRRRLRPNDTLGGNCIASTVGVGIVGENAALQVTLRINRFTGWRRFVGVWVARPCFAACWIDDVQIEIRGAVPV